MPGSGSGSATATSKKEEKNGGGGDDGIGDVTGNENQDQPEKSEASFRREHFEGITGIWDIAAPIAIRDLTVEKDETRKKKKKKKDGDDEDTEEEEEDDLPGAPNFLTAIIGPFLTEKMGCTKKPPKITDSDGGTISKNKKKKRNAIVSNVSVVLNPGEVTLVVAPSSSGKTTLMRTIRNLCEGSVGTSTSPASPAKKSDTISGSVKVGGIDPSDPEYDGCFNRTTSFCDQGDLTLTPILTVEETLRFTSSCANSKLTPEELDDAVEVSLRLSGLSHVAQTVVGDSEVRGVSGGQKRRVKVLESSVGQDVRCLFLDEITNGLDSASALVSCQNFKVAAEKIGIAAVVCLLQPSVDMYHTFHRVVVLTQDGEMAYSGPREGALVHFESLGLIKPEGMAEPEFILRCAFMPSEFQHEEGGATLVPADLARLFADSDAGAALRQELDAAESTKAKEGPTPIRDFARPFRGELPLLMGRAFKLVLRNPGSFVRILFAVIFGFFIGTLFLNIPADEQGTRTRAGYAFTVIMLFFNIAVNAPLESNFSDRLTFYTHRQASFYRTATYYLSNMICGWPVTFLEVTLLSVCTFFLVGMESYGGPGFLYFWLVAVVVAFNGNGLSRVISYSFPSTDVAMALGPAILMVFTLTSGFAPQYPDIPVWLRWISWLSPGGYAFEGIIVNELHTRNIDGTNISGNEYGRDALSVPRVPYDQAGPGMQTPLGVMFFDVYMIIALTIVFEVAGCILLHQSQKWYGPTTKRHQVTSGMSLTAQTTNVAGLLGKKKDGGKVMRDDESGVAAEEMSAVPRAPPLHLTAKDVVYEVDYVAPKEKEEEREKGGANEKGKAEMKDGDQSVATIPDSSILDVDEPMPMTAREYGQPGKGAAREWILKRTLGEDALSSRSVLSSAASSGIVGIDELEAVEAGAADAAGDLDPPEPGRLRLLSGITATFPEGSMTALMGSSGAGKTTLLDVLAGYKTGGHTTAEIFLNGSPKTNEKWRLIAGYCEQTDLHNPAMTVRESLIFATRMRLRPFSLSEDVKSSHIEEIMRLLEIEEYADILVGDEALGQGLPKHARKRLTLGVELAANPSILFADEPTSGLDSVSASLVVSSLQRVAKTRGVTIVCTIHQPSKEVFETFDNLLLLRKGGVVVYNGAISKISDYMTSVSGNSEYALKPGANPADHALEFLCGEKEDWAKLFKQSPMAASIKAVVEEASREPAGIDASEDARGVWSELMSVLQRQLVSHWRTPTYMSVRFWWTLIGTLLTSLFYMNLPATTDGAFNLVGASFGFVNLATIPLTSAAAPLIKERAVFYRETSSGTYRKFVYAIAVEVAEIPFNLGMALLSWIIFYWVVGLDTRADRVIYNLLMAFAVYWTLPLIGQLFSFLSPNLGIAAVMGGLLLISCTLTMGFLIPPASIPPWWIWLYWINPLRYVLQGLAANELGGGKEYLDELTGEYVSGDILLDNLGGWSFDTRWWYCYVVILLFGFGASAALLGAVRINYVKR